MKIVVLYFAHVRDITGLPQEVFDLETGTLASTAFLYMLSISLSSPSISFMSK